ncbi:DUF1640 domain-containing protein [Massilia horti]|uniref:DUF1640 domain-containing protein n=1 Tax=Massilia horti TaxID=2562153 RepID=A0A4Y9TAC1_9BURK|nr:DUF1640 domain-containing protein [Massilia horti]TFW35657.1 DUF1640 domain-containing protein [Massilia horti]
MADMHFDTQKMVERLEGAGVPSPQARAHSAGLAEVVNAFEATITERFASKQDLEKLKTQLIAWVVSVVVSVGILQTTLIVALVLKLLP